MINWYFCVIFQLLIQKRKNNGRKKRQTNIIIMHLWIVINICEY